VSEGRPTTEQKLWSQIQTEEFLPVKLGEAIRYVRKERGLTLRELAERSGISENYLGLIETGSKVGDRDRNISFQTFNSIAAQLRVPASWILFLAVTAGDDQETSKSKEVAEMIRTVQKLIQKAILFDSRGLDP
jgi:transcriptional regulator with XRE-family HTH domain